MSDPAHPKIARPDHEILDVIRERWSPRAFDPAREVSRADLRRLFEAARWAPSSFNEQPWNFVVTDRRRSPPAFAALHGSLIAANQAWTADVPVLALVVVRTTLARDEALNSHAWYDAGQAVAFLALQATASGLAIRQVQGFDREDARRACQVPERFEPAVILAIGYAGDPDALTIDTHRAAERAPRQRRAIDTFVFEDQWGRPISG
jgi:nitroreductase